jgi:hypothetical protein
VDVAVGGANSRLNVEKLLSVKELMRAKHVDFEREQIYCILTAKDESALMREAEITSREFNGDAPVMQDGRLVRFLGINFIYCELAETCARRHERSDDPGVGQVRNAPRHVE